MKPSEIRKIGEQLQHNCPICKHPIYWHDRRMRKPGDRSCSGRNCKCNMDFEKFRELESLREALEDN